MAKPLILIGDPGHDDAIAWLLINTAREYDIKAVISASGNQTIEKTTYNSGRICALLGIDAPRAQGLKAPLCGELITAGNFHGESGLDGPVLPEPITSVSDMSGADLMKKIIDESSEKVTILSTGPQTDVADLIMKYPDVKEKIQMVSIMGGGITTGNWTQAAEFNILVDPEAAKILFDSGLNVTMCGLDVTEKALIYAEDVERIREIDNPVAKVCAGWLDFFFLHHEAMGYTGSPLHDPCAAAVLICPEIFKYVNAVIDVETDNCICRGATIGDIDGKITGRKPNVVVTIGLDRDAFVDMLINACHFYD